MATATKRTTKKKPATRTKTRTKKAVAKTATKRLKTRRATTAKKTTTKRKTTKRAAASAKTRKRSTKRRVQKRTVPVVEPTLWPHDQTGIVSLSERVVIEVEAASFIVTWAVLSAMLTAVGILILFRAPILV